MASETTTYNPHFQFNYSNSYFADKIKYQDEVPDCFAKTVNDSSFTENQIVQVNISRETQYHKSIFTNHELKARSSKLSNLPSNYSDWASSVLLACVVVFAATQYSNFKRLQVVFKAFAVPRFFSQLAREANSFTERPTMILFSLYLVLCGFFITRLLIVNNEVASGLDSFILFIKVLSGAIAFYLLKIGIISFSGKVFKATREASDYILSIYLFGQTMGVVILPFALIIAYNFSIIAVYSFFVIYSISYIYRIFRGMIYISVALKVPMYYLFIYLCTLEILPLVVLLKYVLIILN